MSDENKRLLNCSAISAWPGSDLFVFDLGWRKAKPFALFAALAWVPAFLLCLVMAL